MASVHEQVASAIVAEQTRIMGKVAAQIAGRVNGLSVGDDGSTTISGDPDVTIEGLVKEFSTLTGPLGVRMCYNAAKPVLDSSGVAIPVFSHLQ